MLFVTLALAGSSAARPAPPAVVSRPGSRDCELFAEVVAVSRADLDDGDVIDGLRAALECRSVAGLPLSGTLDAYTTLNGLLEVDGRYRTDLGVSERVDRALLLAELSQEFGRASLVGSMVGLALELTAIEVLESSDVGPLERREVRRRAAGFAGGPVPSLEHDRFAVETMVHDAPITEMPFGSWCVAGHRRATVELEGLLQLSGDARREALGEWRDSNPSDGLLPWTRAGEMCRRGLPEVLIDWHDDREDADARWAALAR